MLNIAFQIDPIEHVDVNGDSTSDIALECVSHGHHLWVHPRVNQPQYLSVEDGQVHALAACGLRAQGQDDTARLDDFVGRLSEALRRDGTVHG